MYVNGDDITSSDTERCLQLCERVWNQCNGDGNEKSYNILFLMMDEKTYVM